MTAETMKTFPATGSLSTEISDYEETRPIFTDMVNDLKKLVNKHHDIGMLPLECQCLNKAALVSVVSIRKASLRRSYRRSSDSLARAWSDLATSLLIFQFSHNRFIDRLDNSHLRQNILR